MLALKSKRKRKSPPNVRIARKKPSNKPATVATPPGFGSVDLQPKLKIGESNDKYEQEADRVADEVMRMPEPMATGAAAVNPGASNSSNYPGSGFSSIQRKCTECATEDEDKLQRKSLCGGPAPLRISALDGPIAARFSLPRQEFSLQRQEDLREEEEEDEGLIQAKTTGGVTPEVTPAVSAGVQSLQGGGRPSSGSERSFFEPRFGADFSKVRLHNDTRAAASAAQSVNARAFTLGHNVVFGDGQYSPDALAGRKLLAHELTHVVQQNGGPTFFSKGKNSENKIPNSQELGTVSPEFVQRKAVDGAAGPGVAPPIVHEVLQSPGQPLDPTTRSFMESRFGREFSKVRIHAGARAKESADALGARAYTLGRHVIFGANQYAPRSPEGTRLLAHELAHTIQQGEIYSSSSNSNPTSRKLIQRDVTKSLVEAEKASYSTNCGWIDWTHAGFTTKKEPLPRTLIEQVRNVSKRIASFEAPLEKLRKSQLKAEAPRFTQETKCAVRRDPREAQDSTNDTPVVDRTVHPSRTVDTVLGGFGVGTADATKFDDELQKLVELAVEMPRISGGVDYVMKVIGFSDCIEDQKLRTLRAAAVARALSNASTPVSFFAATADSYLSSNVDRDGRRTNRGVFVRFIPTGVRAKPETFSTRRMESRDTRLTGPVERFTDRIKDRTKSKGALVSGVTPTVTLRRSLTDREILSVALTIFAVQSFAFEDLQRWRENIVTDVVIPPSSFAEEDLPSNLIGFYVAARKFDRTKVAQLCDEWDEAPSLEKLDGYVFKRNRTWRPPNLPEGGAWPAEFQTITAEPFDSDAFQIVSLRREAAGRLSEVCRVDEEGTRTCR